MTKGSAFDRLVSSPEPAVSRADVDDRGLLRIPPRVIERIAIAAINEIDDAISIQRRVFGLDMGRARAARARATIEGDITSLHVSVAARYPVPLKDLAYRIRHKIMQRVGQMAGLTVGRIDVVITGLLTKHDQKTR